MIFSLLGAALLRPPKWKKGLLVTALTVLLVFSNPFIFKMVSNWWEPAPIAFQEIEEAYDYAIVLGGFTRMWAAPLDRHNFNQFPNRFTNAIELHHLKKAKHLIFVSGSPSSADPALREADLAVETALRFGLDDDDLTALSTNLNTFENAIECRDYFTQNEIDLQTRLLVVTSAFHVRRAKKCFENAGFKPDFFPTDHQTNRSPNQTATFSNTVLPSAATFVSWNKMIRE
ncbi:YdcF family protein, partial [bacterium]|nr:YdcF family protein [bacterium]